jgi:serine protease Do
MTFKKTVPFTAMAAALLIGAAQMTAAKDTSPLDLARQLNEAFIQVADQASAAVVVIEVTGKTTEDDSDDSSLWDALPPELRRFMPHGRRNNAPHKFQGLGSGIIVTADGYILTNNHVVDNADTIKVRFKDGRVFDGKVKGTDPESDIAVVKIDASGLTPAKLGDSDATRVGEFVIAIGAPFELSYSVTVGHVSAKGRSFEGEFGGYADQDFIQTDASINPGNSGGPLVNLYGEVIAINSMIEGMNTGIGFAIPINMAKRVMTHLIDEGKFTRSWLGVRIEDLRNDADYQGLEDKLAPDTHDGVVVEQIEPNGPASKSDLRPGDVVTAVDSKPVATSRQLKDIISAEKPGHTAVLDVVRAHEHIAIKVTVAALPTEQEMAAETPSSSGEIEAASLGLTVEPMSKDLASQYGIDVIPGVVVTAVADDSPAQARGIQPGDVITEINRKKVTNARQFREALKSADKRKGMMLNLMSNGASRFVVLKPTPE